MINMKVVIVMKKIKLFILLILSFVIIDVYASGGTLKQDSIIECNGEYFGNHGQPLHWHKAKLNKGMWVSDGGEVEVPNCYIKPINTYEEVTFSKCVDGDTAKFIIKDQEKIVRMLAIDTPESVKPNTEVEYYAKDASSYTCNLLSNAKKITLEYDANSDKEDKYGRVLAFVWVDDELLESTLVRNGYAKVEYIYGDYNHVDELRKLESIAKEEKIGIWGEENNLGDTSLEINNEEDSDEKITLWDIIVHIFRIIYNFIVNLFA